MAGFTVLVFILIPAAVVSIGLASLRWRKPAMRAAVLAAHVAASVCLIMFLSGPTNLWIIVLGPGLAIALMRLVGLAHAAVRPKSRRIRWRRTVEQAWS